MSSPRFVTLDGPSASGKSTVAKQLASALGWAYLDTGATYRAVTLACLRSGIAPTDGPAATELAASIITAGRLALGLDPKRPEVRLDGEDVTSDVRGADVTGAVSAVSAHPTLRVVLVDWQRRLATQAGECVLEGRDTGAVVVPDAEVKVWLTARPEIRAERRAAEDGASAGADLARRDTHDATRAADPMKPAADAIILDSSELTIEQIVALLLERVRH